jgi:hypothetical protein
MTTPATPVRHAGVAAAAWRCGGDRPYGLLAAIGEGAILWNRV